MDQATSLITAAVWKIVSLILALTVLMLIAGAASFVLANRNPQWSKVTKQAVHSGLVFTAAAVWVVILLAWMRPGT